MSAHTIATFTVSTVIAYRKNMLTSNYPVSVSVIPGASGSVRVYASLTDSADTVPDGSAQWHEWDFGVVSTATLKTLTSPVTALKFVATTSNATVEICA